MNGGGRCCWLAAIVLGVAGPGMGTAPAEGWPATERIHFLHEGMPSLALWQAANAARERANAAGHALQERWEVSRGAMAGRSPTALVLRGEPHEPAQAANSAGVPVYALGEAERVPGGLVGDWCVEPKALASALWETLLHEYPLSRNLMDVALGVLVEAPEDPFTIAILEGLADPPARTAEFTIRDIVLADSGPDGIWPGLREVAGRERARPAGGWWLLGARATTTATGHPWAGGPAGMNRPILVAWADDAATLQALLAGKLDAVVFADYAVLGARIVRDRLARWRVRAAEQPEIPDYLRRRAAELESAWQAEDAARPAIRVLGRYETDAIRAQLRQWVEGGDARP